MELNRMKKINEKIIMNYNYIINKQKCNIVEIFKISDLLHQKQYLEYQ
jgi:hypothetical protein